mmetsp:Transcript_33911/g.56938  ORF Transcript_33911/g.56938 Transcript_33911/m.56938 type:complete len:1260 (-) Transcript_33911:212-3991(-)|eukprot:CAMPEP_0198212112 /NCGR_PEP_ID=MMETSP1445-20131203/25527_1 /TAXON_ID=36898 /ORGANISM="Pyramimonas sp., Strain CCMP2087" /LENGTH=1259 /DNA_ID=CAMNT_0043886493 /DNA_START=620 /DNA_END=4399 /DNA_ORIENTATION=-
MSEGMSEGSAGSASADRAICAEVTASSPQEEGEAQVEASTIVAFPDHTETEDEEEDQRISDEHEAFVETDDSGRFGRYDEILGAGSSKIVYRGFDELKGIEIAWNKEKVGSNQLALNEEGVRRLKAEAEILKNLRHKNIIRIYHSWVDWKTNDVNFITEIFTHGNLLEYTLKHKHIDVKVLKGWARQILSGLVYLHGQTPVIIHRDLKCENIFINGATGEIKIADLGVATKVKDGDRMASTVIGTPEFMAPELYEESYDEKVDIYAFGMLILELYSREHPFRECANHAQIFKKVMSGELPESLSKVKDKNLKEFIQCCIVQKAEDRPSASELQQHPFLVKKEEPKLSKLDSRRSLDQSSEHRASVGERTLSGGSFTSEKHNPSGQSEGSSEGSEVSSRKTSKEQTSATYVVKEVVPTVVGGSHKGEEVEVEVEQVEPLDASTLKMRLKIARSEGRWQSVEFTFGHKDTPDKVAREMVEQLDISATAMSKIASDISREVKIWKAKGWGAPTAPGATEAVPPVVPAVDTEAQPVESPAAAIPAPSFSTSQGISSPSPPIRVSGDFCLRLGSSPKPLLQSRGIMSSPASGSPGEVCRVKEWVQANTHGTPLLNHAYHEEAQLLPEASAGGESMSVTTDGTVVVDAPLSDYSFSSQQPVNVPHSMPPRTVLEPGSPLPRNNSFTERRSSHVHFEAEQKVVEEEKRVRRASAPGPLGAESGDKAPEQDSLTPDRVPKSEPEQLNNNGKLFATGTQIEATREQQRRLPFYWPATSMKRLSTEEAVESCLLSRLSTDEAVKSCLSAKLSSDEAVKSHLSSLPSGGSCLVTEAALQLAAEDAEDYNSDYDEEEEKMLDEKQRKEEEDLKQRHLAEKERIMQKKKLKSVLARSLSCNLSSLSAEVPSSKLSWCDGSSTGSAQEGAQVTDPAYVPTGQGYLQAVTSPSPPCVSPRRRRSLLDGRSDSVPNLTSLDTSWLPFVAITRDEHAPSSAEQHTSTNDHSQPGSGPIHPHGNGHHDALSFVGAEVGSNGNHSASPSQLDTGFTFPPTRQSLDSRKDSLHSIVENELKALRSTRQPVLVKVPVKTGSMRPPSDTHQARPPSVDGSQSMNFTTHSSVEENRDKLHARALKEYGQKTGPLLAVAVPGVPQAPPSQVTSPGSTGPCGEVRGSIHVEHRAVGAHWDKERELALGEGEENKLKICTQEEVKKLKQVKIKQQMSELEMKALLEISGSTGSKQKEQKEAMGCKSSASLTSMHSEKRLENQPTQ